MQNKVKQFNLQEVIMSSDNIVLIDRKELSKIINMKEHWISRNSPNMVGAIKFGGSWRYDVNKIMQYISEGKNIVVKST